MDKSELRNNIENVREISIFAKGKTCTYNFFNFSMMGAMQELCQFKGKDLYQTLESLIFNFNDFIPNKLCLWLISTFLWAFYHLQLIKIFQLSDILQDLIYSSAPLSSLSFTLVSVTPSAPGSGSR